MIQIWTSDFQCVLTLLCQLKLAAKNGQLFYALQLLTFGKLGITCLVSTHGNDRQHECLLANSKLRE